MSEPRLGRALAHSSTVLTNEQPIAAARSHSREGALRPVLGYVLFGALPAVFLLGMLWAWVGDQDTGFDLRYAFLDAARHVVHGTSPYPHLADRVIHEEAAYVYPPFVALLTTPLTLLSTSTAVHVGFFVSLALVPVALYVLDVRDPRCYLVALVWAPVGDSLRNVAISIPLAAVLAGAWRLRRSEGVAGVLLGAALVSKLFLVPMLAWPAAMRRWRAAGIGAAAAIVLAFASWAVIGFDGLGRYPSLLRKLTNLEERDSYSLSGTLRVLGLGATPARMLGLLVAVALAALALELGRRDDDRRCFTALLIASLAATPLLWQHYLVTLLVAVAIARPRLSFAWVLPVVLWASPFVGNGSTTQTLLVPLVAACVGLACLVDLRPQELLGRLGLRASSAA